ncbi:hypothetical protein DPEC_G00206490 [Dallia pectoralis]|uniref:Uncharacterized protein n=1 Tax=Dallia pectoralis TaxID=75939 RepID=A0ACC2G4S1_DALPE|nr:hypothetical protein DPEC_G00206490 [Dallia pectoralis]
MAVLAALTYSSPRPPPERIKNERGPPVPPRAGPCPPPSGGFQCSLLSKDKLSNSLLFYEFTPRSISQKSDFGPNEVCGGVAHSSLAPVLSLRHSRWRGALTLMDTAEVAH